MQAEIRGSVRVSRERLQAFHDAMYAGQTFVIELAGTRIPARITYTKALLDDLAEVHFEGEVIVE